MLSRSAALLLFILLLPLLLALALLIRLLEGPPVLYRQWRMGQGGRPFLLYKFRTLKNDPPESGDTEPDTASDLTQPPIPGGRLLRAGGLDELPQLINVLKGQMNLVGPRPLPCYYGPYLSVREKGRHRIKPGLAGPAQLYALRGSGLSWTAKFRLDLRYTRRKSPVLDARILALTLCYIIRRLLHPGTPSQPAPDLRQVREKVDFNNPTSSS